MFDDFDDEDDDFSTEDIEKEHERVRNMPISKKGNEILKLVMMITDLISDEDDELQNIKGLMIENAALLTVKIAGAEAAEIYDLKMEAAAFIRRAARDLQVSNHSLKTFGFQYVEYFDMVRKLIEEYRILFVDWVANFDKTNYLYDDWGLFNPPNVSPDKDFF